MELEHRKIIDAWPLIAISTFKVPEVHYSIDITILFIGMSVKVYRGVFLPRLGVELSLKT